MSDERLRELERRFRQEPTDRAHAFALARERARVALEAPATSWDGTADGRHLFARVTRKEVIVGSGTSRFDEGAATAKHEAFLRGELQDLVVSEHGPEVLVAMLEATLRAPALFASENAEVATRQRHLAGIPVDPSLSSAPLVEGPVWWAGTRRLLVPSETQDLEVVLGPDGQRSTLVTHGTGARRPVPGLAVSAAVGIADRFYVASACSYLVVEPTGELHRPADAALFGSDLRIDRVSRLGDAAVFGYWWFDRDDGEPGLLRYEHDRGIVARCDRRS